MPKLQPYQRLQTELEELIVSNKPGTKLLAEPQLARKLGVSRSTLREAMRTFEVQGLIRRKQGQGTFIVAKQKPLEGGLEVLESIETLSEKTGLQVYMGELQITNHMTAGEFDSDLPFADDCMIVKIERTILAENRPIAYLIDILPDDIIKKDELENGFLGSILDWLLNRGDLELTRSRSKVDSILSSSRIARKLQIQRGAPLLYFEADLFDASDRIVDHSYSYFIPGFFNFHIVRNVNTKNNIFGGTK